MGCIREKENEDEIHNENEQNVTADEVQDTDTSLTYIPGNEVRN